MIGLKGMPIKNVVFQMVKFCLVAGFHQGGSTTNQATLSSVSY